MGQNDIQKPHTSKHVGFFVRLTLLVLGGGACVAKM